MSKEYMEAFGRIILHTEYDNDSSYDCLNFEDDCKLVDNALLELKVIKDANPSEALECLRENHNHSLPSSMPMLKWEDNFKIVEQYILKAQEQEKILKIIKEKPYQCAPTILYIQINKNNPKMLDYERYTMSVKYVLPEEDFETLVRCIKNE